MKTDNQTPDDLSDEPVALKRLRRFIDGRRDLPSSGHAGRQIATLVSEPGVLTRDLVDVALTDPAVVVRLVRIANGVTYQNREREEVSSVQRAIDLMGQNQVRESVLSLPQIDTVVNADRMAVVASELGKASFCARFARNFLDTRNPLVSDEGAVLTVLARLWPIVGALSLPNEFAALRFVDRQAPRMAESMQRELFGLSPVLLTKAIVESWVLPLNSHPQLILAEQRPSPVIAGRDWLPLAIGIAVRVGEAIELHTPQARDEALREILVRYRRCVDLTPESFLEHIEESADEAIGLERSIGRPESKRNTANFLAPFLKHQTLETDAWEPLTKIDSTGIISRVQAQKTRMQSKRGNAESVLRTAAGKPVDSVVQLQSWRTRIEAICDDYSRAEDSGQFAESGETAFNRIEQPVLSVVMNAILESLGYGRVVWFSKTPGVDQFTPALCIGTPISRLGTDEKPELACDGLILAALIGQIELHIADCEQTTVTSSLPDWFFQHFPTTRSFLVLPVGVGDQLHGFMFADRSCTDPQGLEDEELSLVLAIRDRLNRLLSELSDTVVQTEP